jgi:DNA-binding transcriptional MerR regulator
MFTVNEVSKIAGISVRTLQYYDKIGLLPPSGFTDSGYRLYNEASLEKLQTILLFRELEFPLKEIKEIIGNPDFDKEKAVAVSYQMRIMIHEKMSNIYSSGEEKELLFNKNDKPKIQTIYYYDEDTDENIVLWERGE